MNRLIVMLIALLLAAASSAQADAEGLRAKALAALGSAEAKDRAEATAFIAMNGVPTDDKVLLPRLLDDNATVREVAEQGLWLLWTRSGDAPTDALMKRGLEEMQSGQLRDAVATFSEIIAARPAFAEGWNKRATALFLAGELRKSLADCDEVVKRNPNHFGALAGYGQIYFQMDEYAKAIQYWKRALAVNPNMGALVVNIREAEERLGKSRRQTT